MAIATTLLDNPQNALTALLSQGIGALNTAVNNAINVGRDRATTQLNQENTIFNVLKNEEALRQRRAENLRRNFEVDRLFGRTVARDARQDFVTDRAFNEEVFQDDRRYMMDKIQENRAAESAKRTAEHLTTTEQQAGQRLELDAQTRTVNLLRLQEEQRQTDLLRERSEGLRDEAMGATGNLLADPLQATTIPTPELERYVDLFGVVPSPDVQGRVASARRELATRNPEVDPVTGRKIPDRFAPDRTNPFEDRDPSEYEFIATTLANEIADLEETLKTARGSAKSTIVKEISRKREQLRKAPVEVQKRVIGGVPLTDPSVIDPASLFRK